MKEKEIAEILMQSKNLEASIIIIQEYAKAQIEKDRERIKKAYYNETDASDFNNMLKNTPIILD